jgi:hypothetical protein
MPNYSATIRVFDVGGSDRAAAQHALEEKLQAAGLSRWQIVSVVGETSPLPVRQVRRVGPFAEMLGPLLILGAAAWTLWFYLLLVG